MKKLASLFITVACISSGMSPGIARADGIEPIDMPSDNRMKILMYNDQDVYTITTKYGYQTNIVFDKNEEIQTISVGDRSMWQLVPTGNRLFIRPMEDGASTNMTLITNKHSYQFDLKSVASDKDNGMIYVAKFIYPEKHHELPMAMSQPEMPVTETPAKPVMLANAVPESPPAPVATPEPVAPATVPAETQPAMEEPEHPALMENPIRRNDRYSFSGPDNLAPLEVFDNGSSTFIKFRDMAQPLPDPYVVDAHGLEKPVNYIIQDNMMVIGRVVGEFEFKGPNGNVSVYNELLDPR